MRLTIFITGFLFFFTKTMALEERDTILTAPKSVFLKDFVGRKGFVYPAIGQPNAFLRFQNPIYAAKPQILLKNGHSLSITIGSSGRIYECIGENDTSYLFKRLDHSSNHNYNIGGYYFYYRGGLYCFAGYGFWKNDGILKFFNRKDSEWDFVSMEREIIPQVFNIGNTWFDHEQNRLYVPFQSKVNAGIAEEENIKGIIDPASFVLDLGKNKWQKIGVASEKILDVFRNGNAVINTTHGLLVNQGQDVYWIDFKKNSISISTKSSFIQSIIRAQQKGFLYHHKNHIFFYNAANGTTDSIGLNKDDFMLLSDPIWERKTDLPLMIGFILSPIIFLLFMSWQKLSLGQETSTIAPVKKGNYQLEFNDIEKALLKLLWEKTHLGRNATVPDINYVLGIKDKKTGMQKKVRSDIFNSIQEKYSYLSKSNTPLILSIRSEDDKRFFEFCLSQEGITHIKDLFQ
jgi:hypothetical protein